MAQTFTTRPDVRGTFGAVSSTHWLGSATGFGILERGGNAFDAAVATAFVLQIVEPHLNGPGGDMVALFQRADADSPSVLCGQGVAPARATIPEFTSRGFTHVPGTGHLPAVVPGAFGAWMHMLAAYGTMRLRDVLSPSIEYATNGFPAAYRAAASIAAGAEFMAAEWPSSAAVWLPHGHAPKPGVLIKTPAIGATYARILAEAEAASSDREAQIEAARNAFYAGFVADAIDRFLQIPIADGTGGRHAGLLDGADMARWRPSEEPTLSLSFRGVEVHKAGAWTQGPTFLQSLAILDGFDLDRVIGDDEAFVHHVVETMKLTLADREGALGDPAHVDVPLEQLLSPHYAAERRGEIADTADHKLRLGSAIPNAGARHEALMRLSGAQAPQSAIGLGEPTFADLPEVEGDTVHFDIIDRHGNIVSATPSGGWLQSSPAVPELGFNITTRGQMFWLDDALPGALAPGRRPRITLTPTIVKRDDGAMLGIGTPGGDQQEQWILSTLLRIVVARAGLQAAIDAPQFHTTHYIASFFPRTYEPGTIRIEDRFSEATRAALRERGHTVVEQGSWSLGRVCAAGRMDGMVRAAATPRFMEAYAIGR